MKTKEDEEVGSEMASRKAMRDKPQRPVKPVQYEVLVGWGRITHRGPVLENAKTAYQWALDRYGEHYDVCLRKVVVEVVHQYGY